MESIREHAKVHNLAERFRLTDLVDKRGVFLVPVSMVEVMQPKVEVATDFDDDELFTSFHAWVFDFDYCRRYEIWSINEDGEKHLIENGDSTATPILGGFRIYSVRTVSTKNRTIEAIAYNDLGSESASIFVEAQLEDDPPRDPGGPSEPPPDPVERKAIAVVNFYNCRPEKRRFSVWIFDPSGPHDGTGWRKVGDLPYHGPDPDISDKPTKVELSDSVVNSIRIVDDALCEGDAHPIKGPCEVYSGDFAGDSDGIEIPMVLR